MLSMERALVIAIATSTINGVHPHGRTMMPEGREEQKLLQASHKADCTFSPNFFGSTSMGLDAGNSVSCRQNRDCIIHHTKDESPPCCLFPSCVCGRSNQEDEVCVSSAAEGDLRTLNALSEVDSEKIQLSSEPPADTCIDHPIDWFDAQGPTYNCQWYALNDRCIRYGHLFPNGGYSANDACCACNGGIGIKTASPTGSPSASPTTSSPTMIPTSSPTKNPTSSPSFLPTILPITDSPTSSPSIPPTLNQTTSSPTPVPTLLNPNITYNPGNFSMNTILEDDEGREVVVSNGLTGRAIAYVDEKVRFTNEKGGKSKKKFHSLPDGAATFPSDSGGFYYTSNSEVPSGEGGVYSIEFDQDGEVIDYFPVLEGTNRNCGGGRTPWGSWVSCEEYGSRGHVYQCDPSGVMESRQTSVVAFGGHYESFSYDIRYPTPTFYTTEDSTLGALVRFTPNDAGINCYNAPSDSEKWCTLDHGTHDYLQLHPVGNGDSGTFAWVQNKTEANPSEYPLSEGIDVVNGLLHFVTKRSRKLFILNLDDMTYTRHSTESGAFDGGPDQIASILNDPHGIVYFCEEGGRRSGVHGRDSTAQYFSILDGPGYRSETTGLSFSPDSKFMLVSFQDDGVIWQFWRTDGLKFSGGILDIKYHA